MKQSKYTTESSYRLMGDLETLKKKSHFLLAAVLFVLSALYNIHYAEAANASDLTFQWQANPTEENVVGYRLYYGPDSRYNTDGSLKDNFSYPQFIDFADMVRCSGPDYNDCEALSLQDLQCENLYSENPRCTVYGLNGTLFFTMTACTNSAESIFTTELQSATPQQLQAIGHIIDILLLSE